ncbi:Uncharacterised protein (plasmid) [Tsukamurella tyrosinosolvens]|uniref:Uncharacterized protein n=1 Tax=Tsukamurella tyrosinosolvens TaxID=57704 RepID=A0A1H4V6G6_TSUTY|nr:hypothetical protein [Tsukamurella tyrosinosolvens]KXO91037.1 hypothetical protein AXK58_21645 [Tsukamurella tyrosinosolvens]SEC76535.1 hypothetical protein SAMN04489793_3156 [Tsukamurella tyrosinosolvens]VEH90658.1 Uncharacterised protein [Tsukamurella tyrosinosolvens]
MIRIEFDTSNAAFQDDFGGEIARILRMVAGDFANGHFNDHEKDRRYLLDINGGTVGHLSVNGG